MAHFLGGVFKYFAAALIFVFSMSLGFSFFDSIAPAHMPWFTLAAMGMTEFGLLCWLAVFMLQKHHDAHKTLALVMIFVCVIAVIFTDAMELARQFGTTFFLASLYYYGLIVLFCAHLLALITDFFISYFAIHPFYGGQHSPTPQPRNRQAQPKEESSGETDSPLEQAMFAQTARLSMPAIPFFQRMKAGIVAFRGQSLPAQQQSLQSTANSQSEQVFVKDNQQEETSKPYDKGYQAANQSQLQPMQTQSS